MEKIFESSCKLSPFDDLIITRENGDYVFTINTYCYDELSGQSILQNSNSVVLCKPQTVKAITSILADTISYQGEVEKID